MRINIGCGVSATKNWMNFDNSFSLTMAKYPLFVLNILLYFDLLDKAQYEYIKLANNLDIKYADAAVKIPVKDASVEVLYSSHMFEHLDRAEADSFLQEAFRVLMPGGIIRLAVPDLERIINSYNENKDANEFVASLCMSVQKPQRLRERLKLLLVGPRQHHWMYDKASLCKILQNHGFSDAVGLMPGETRIADPGSLNLREREEESLYVEAVKPA